MQRIMVNEWLGNDKGMLSKVFIECLVNMEIMLKWMFNEC